MGDGFYIVIEGGERYGDMRFFGPFYYENDADHWGRINCRDGFVIEQLERPEMGL